MTKQLTIKNDCLNCRRKILNIKFFLCFFDNKPIELFDLDFL